MKLLILAALSCVVLAGCNMQNVKTGVDIGCATTTKEYRAEVRSKQNIPTDLCGDLDVDTNTAKPE